MNKYNGFGLIKANLPNTFQYYRDLLDSKEKKHYDCLLNGIIEFKSDIQIKGIETNSIGNLFNYIKMDHPLLFYVESLNIRYETRSKTVIVNPKYRFDEKKTNQTLLAVLSKVKNILTPYSNADQQKKEIIIHDFFCNNDIYDTNFAISSYECVGPLLFGKGVCEGISKGVKLLCDYSGIRCIVLHGKANRPDNVFGEEGHAWNKIEINSCFYNLDVTFDLTISSKGVKRYDYYNISDIEILKDHKFDSTNTPACDNNNSYYYTNQLCFNSLKEIKKYFIAELKNKRKCFVLKVISESPKHIQEKEILKCFSDALVITNHYYQKYQYSYNEYQNVMQIDLI